MKKYIALLRGINISGKNKISMTELKSYFIEVGFVDVFTHLNSGNIVFVILQEELKDLLSKAPVWWGTDNKEICESKLVEKTASCRINQNKIIVL